LARWGCFVEVAMALPVFLLFNPPIFHPSSTQSSLLPLFLSLLSLSTIPLFFFLCDFCHEDRSDQPKKHQSQPQMPLSVQEEPVLPVQGGPIFVRLRRFVVFFLEFQRLHVKWQRIFFSFIF
jgi:hypothetical protein